MPTACPSCPLPDGSPPSALSGGCRRNRDWLADKVALAAGVAPELAELAWAPQTSGGLLVAVAREGATRLVERLHDAGVSAAAAIGVVEERAEGAWVILR